MPFGLPYAAALACTGPRLALDCGVKISLDMEHRKHLGRLCLAHGSGGGSAWYRDAAPEAVLARVDPWLIGVATPTPMPSSMLGLVIVAQSTQSVRLCLTQRVFPFGGSIPVDADRDPGAPPPRFGSAAAPNEMPFLTVSWHRKHCLRPCFAQSSLYTSCPAKSWSSRKGTAAMPALGANAAIAAPFSGTGPCKRCDAFCEGSSKTVIVTLLATDGSSRGFIGEDIGVFFAGDGTGDVCGTLSPSTLWASLSTSSAFCAAASPSSSSSAASALSSCCDSSMEGSGSGSGSGARSGLDSISGSGAEPCTGVPMRTASSSCFSPPSSSSPVYVS
mmetsp:Transcript_26241/g.81747  ORF Transcript_26241/g.81747 Transcript_26241/m.81747 type:complete len:332 (-) Transcript_26241:2344-3339(-)